MAKILFVMKYPLEGFDNLIPKFNGQMEAVGRLGHEAYWLGWDKQGVWLCSGKEKRLMKKTVLTGLPGYSHTLLFRHLMDALAKAVAAESFSLVYLRYMPTFGNAVRALKAAKARGAKLVVEHPTYPFQNGKKTSPLREPVFRYADRVFKRIVPMIDLYTLIGQPADGEVDGRPAMNIANGVEAGAYPLHRCRGEQPEIGMLALASMTRGQGYDRLLRGMARCGDKRLRLYMAGGEGDGSLAAWKALTDELGLSDQVRFIGQIHGQPLNELAESCDIGIGGLAMHRDGQLCGRTLKLREYMVRGLPFIYAVNDPDMPTDERFCLNLPNDESPLDMNAIIRFAENSQRHSDVPALMRRYAEERLSWVSQLRPVLERVGIPCQEPSSI